MKSFHNISKIKKIVLFASGNGSNVENIVRFFLNDSLVDVVAVITNNPNAGVIDRCVKLDVKCVVLPKNTCLDRQLLHAELLNFKPDLIVLAGYLLKIPEEIAQTFKIINIHPALLPKYGGKGMYGHHVHEAVMANKEGKTGISIHYVNDKYDDGQIIFQASCQIDPSDNAQSIAQKVHHLEMMYFPKIIAKILHG